jgi:uncharacterized membrane protein affecting hemolysin expression
MSIADEVWPSLAVASPTRGFLRAETSPSTTQTSSMHMKTTTHVSMHMLLLIPITDV